MNKAESRFSIRGKRAGLALLLLLLLPVLPATLSCSLEENPVSAITPDNFYQNTEEVLGGLAATYAELRNTLWGYYNLSEISTDEMIVPTRGQDWFDNGRWLEIHRQTWAANSPAGLDDINGTWNVLFAGVAKANIVLNALQSVTVADQAIFEAELRALRAFYYYLLMDLFGGVPIVTDTE
ncbi:MAG: RagB/SusD family nutrient uptake outer membrane protein, partial [Gemmatimonadota bacterium]